ncbi:alpha/beta hydrolase [Falsiroseomonas ponticola]|uniref:alpha/beta hydrolase n=1 Tax=Falsiroseomonas ponticola TaxID=2786951 RepID=UPI00193421D8|nr:alpha/beta hydrolase [Roseomonas ponticola]
MTPLPLPPGITSRMVPRVNGLAMHVLEAGQPGRPCLLLLHGFPELAFSWRHVMPRLAAAGYHVIAPDQRGYGRTTGWTADYDAPLAPFHMLNFVRDALALLEAMGIARTHGVIGHDFGSPVAAWCALVRPDIFSRVALMSSPFAGPPARKPAPQEDVHAAMAALTPPRKHYQWYYATRPAAADMNHAPQGLHAFLRAYYHHKSADWAGNKPYPLKGWTATELAKMPDYYIMPLHATMPEAVDPFMPTPAEIAANSWLPDSDLAVYAAEYARTGFQGGLQSYRCNTGGANAADLVLFSGRRIEVPALFISGASDWGTYQFPGAFTRMQDTACADFRGAHLVPGAGHWVQQEQPAVTARLLLDFLQS